MNKMVKNSNESENDMETEQSSTILQPSFSYNSTLTDMRTDTVQRRMNKNEIKKKRYTKTESTYVKNYRFSRYKQGIYAAIPYRKTDTNLEELPVDNVGCFSNASFSWIRKYRISQESLNSLPIYDYSSKIAEKLPKSTYTDSCRVNSKRILGLYKYEEQTHGQQKGSMFRVAWQFCRTRLLIANLLHVLSIFIGLIGLVIFLNKSMTAMDAQRQLHQNITNYTMPEYTFFHGQLMAFFYKYQPNETGTTKTTTPKIEQIKTTATTITNQQPVLIKNSTLSDSISTSTIPTINKKESTAAKFENNIFPTTASTAKSSINSSGSKNSTMDNAKLLQFNKINKNIEYEMLNKLLYSFGLPSCYFGMFFFKSISNWINLRTASRLRTACISSVFSKSIKSSAIYQISPHQIMSIVSEEGELIYSMILKGNQIVGIILGILLYLIGSIILLGAPGMWTLCILLGLIIATIPLSIISTYFYRKSLLYSSKKLTIIEELFNTFRTINYLHLRNKFEILFSTNLSSQFQSLLRSEIFSTKFSGGITSSTLLGGLYLIWCDTNIKTDTIPVLILIIIYAHFIQIFLKEFSESFGFILQGRAALNKVKSSYILQSPQLSKTKPKHNLQISISQAVFEWDSQQSGLFNNDNLFELQNRNKFCVIVDEFFITKQQIIGITGTFGSGKTSLLHSILGHLKLTKGKIYLKGKCCFFPKQSYVRRNGTIKENIIYGSSYDPNKYLDVLIKSQLLNILSDRHGNSDISINSSQLDLYQLQKIDLARAMYCEREIIIFDEPLNAIDENEEASDLFSKVTQYLNDSNKTVIIATQSDNILRHCNRIYVMDEGNVSNNKEYEDIRKLASYNEMVQYYYLMQKSLRSYTSEELPIYEDATTASNTFNPSTNYMNNNSDKLTAHQSGKEKLPSLSVYGKIKLIILYFINIYAYLILPFVFIGVVNMEYIEPWLTLFSLAAIILIILIDIIIRNVISREARKSSKKYQKRLFKKLMNTSLNFLENNSVSEFINTFQDDNFKYYQLSASFIQYIITILIIICFQIYASFWNVFVMIIPIVCTFGIYCYYRFTITHLSKCENESKRLMFLSLTNMLQGRSALQSFEEDYRTELYELIEKNSTALIMRKSIIFHSQFILGIIQVLCFIPLCQTLILIPFTRVSVYHYVFGIFLYLVLSYNLNGFLEVLFERVVFTNKIELNNNFIQGIPVPEVGDELDKKTENEALQINISSIVIKSKNRPRFKINELSINKAENIGIMGTGANFIAPLLHRLLLPNSGAIFVGNRDVSNLSKRYLQHHIGIVPTDPYIYSATIRNILDPEYRLELREITSALQRFHLWEIVISLPNGIDDLMIKLDRKNRQLLCLARCWRRLPPIIIIERPHPDIQKFVDEIIHAYFIESTVIVIGSNDKQFKECKRIIELS